MLGAKHVSDPTEYFNCVPLSLLAVRAWRAPAINQPFLALKWLCIPPLEPAKDGSTPTVNQPAKGAEAAGAVKKTKKEKNADGKAKHAEGKNTNKSGKDGKLHVHNNKKSPAGPHGEAEDILMKRRVFIGNIARHVRPTAAADYLCALYLGLLAKRET